MENQNALTPQQSWEIINQMIVDAKKQISSISFFFQLWGWIMFLAGIAEFLLIEMDYSHSYIGWPIAGISGGIISAIYGRKMDKEQPVRTHLDKVLEYVWYGYIITLIIILVGTISNGIQPNAYVMILTALPTFITGIGINFRPLVIGAFIFWILGTMSLYMSVPYTSLIFSGAILAGYLIPGYLLRKEEKNNV